MRLLEREGNQTTYMYKDKETDFWGGNGSFARSPIQASQVESHHKLKQSPHFPGGRGLLEIKPK